MNYPIINIAQIFKFHCEWKIIFDARFFPLKICKFTAKFEQME